MSADPPQACVWGGMGAFRECLLRRQVLGSALVCLPFRNRVALVLNADSGFSRFLHVAAHDRCNIWAVRLHFFGSRRFCPDAGAVTCAGGECELTPVAGA